MNSNTAVMGLQWGDEGKGKAIDYMAGEYDVVIRYQGGHNAGHTIYYQGNKVVLHLLPSGIFSPNTTSVISGGVIVNPLQLVEEIKQVQALGLPLTNLELSEYCPLILPFHQHLDIIFENSRYIKIGTTRRGIGPAYEDLAGRRAVLVADLFDSDKLYKKVASLNEYYNKLVRTYDGDEIHIDSYFDDYVRAGKFLRQFAGNTIYSLNRYYRENKRILFEGAQGVLLDINFGTYPFVTSSNPTIGGIFTGTGLPHKALDRVIGINKAYTTRVGGGPFPSEIFDDEAEFLREKGGEYGATTGRPRRVGWLDLVAMNYSIMINGVDQVFLTKLDILDEFEEIKVVTDYEINGEKNRVFEPSLNYLEKVKPVTRTFKGWQAPLTEINKYDDLPQRTREYIEFIEKYTNVPMAFLSVGSERHQTIRRTT